MKRSHTPQCVLFPNRENWRDWLEQHHATAREIWLLHYKKKSARQSVTYPDAVEEALCFGWIDGLLKRIDDESYALRYSPRTSRSIWSIVNKRRAEKLMRAGRMSAAGFARIAEAKENGQWAAASAREDTRTLPSDLLQALKKSRHLAAFEQWPASRKKQYLHWLSEAKKPETREKRLRAIVELAAAKK